MEEWSKGDCIRGRACESIAQTQILNFITMNVSTTSEHFCLKCVGHIKWNLSIGDHRSDECTAMNVQNCRMNCCNVSDISTPFYTIIITIKWNYYKQFPPRRSLLPVCHFEHVREWETPFSLELFPFIDKYALCELSFFKIQSEKKSQRATIPISVCGALSRSVSTWLPFCGAFGFFSTTMTNPRQNCTTTKCEAWVFLAANQRTICLRANDMQRRSAGANDFFKGNSIRHECNYFCVNIPFCHSYVETW